MCYLAAVKPVLKNQIKRPTGERLAPIFSGVGPHMALALDPAVSKLVPQRVNRLEREIAPKDLDNDAGLGVVDDELAVLHVITEGRGERLLLPMPDGDQLAARLDRPAGCFARPLIVVVHGLAGSEANGPVMASMWHLVGQGWPVLRLNLRGALPSRPTAAEHYIV